MVPNSVLLIDDEPIVLDVLKIALEKKAFTVVSVQRVTDAVKALETQRFGALLVDKNLPDGSGLDVIRAARSRQPFCACMMMTGYPNVTSILEALRLGAVDYLEKPFPQLNIVQEKVRAVVDRQKVFAERDELLRTVERLKSKDVTATELSMAQSALEVAKADSDAALQAARAEHQQELTEMTDRLEAVRARHLKTLAAARKAAAQLANVIEGQELAKELDQELRETRRLLTSVVDDV